MDLLWSSLYLDNVCDECENCCDSEECNCYRDEEKTELDYDFLTDLINEDFEMKFEENNFEYFVVGESYKNYYGFHQNFVGGYTDLFSNVDDIISHLSMGGCDEGFRIYKDKYNSIIIERIHHDGVEHYKLCRLNKKGQDYYDKGYDIDFRKYMKKSVLKDFDFFNY